jgi:tight adherence protein B
MDPKLQQPLLYVAAFIAVVVAVQTLAGLVFSRRDQRSRINRRMSLLESGMRPERVYEALVRRPMTARLGSQQLSNLLDKFSAYCHQSGLSLDPLRLVGITAAIAAGLWVACLFLTVRSGPGFLVNATVSLIGSCALAVLAVWVFVGQRRKQRIKKLEEQLPLSLDIVNRAIRAGHPVISAVQLAAQEMADPLGSEFGLIVDETTYGVDFRDALTSFARRTGSSDAHFFAVSVSIQSETGGNLAEILDGLATVIRDRITLGKRVRALASEGRASAMILSVLPILLIGGMMVMAPKFYTDKFSDPLFWPIASGVGVMYLIGWVMIHRIVNFKY